MTSVWQTIMYSLISHSSVTLMLAMTHHGMSVEVLMAIPACEDEGLLDAHIRGEAGIVSDRPAIRVQLLRLDTYTSTSGLCETPRDERAHQLPQQA